MLIFAITLGACQKLIDNKPSATQLLDKEVFKDSVTVKAALASLYGDLQYGDRYSVLMSTRPGLTADELTFVGNSFDQFTANVIISDNPDVADLWSTPYSIIYSANAIIEGTPAGSNLSPKFQAQTIAEARFVRAFCHSYLVNLFGDVPLVLTTDVEKNKVGARTPTADVYAQIIEDLIYARDNLPTDYSMSSGLRVRANKWAATALLARTYLYLGRWAEAETQTTAIIENTALFKLEDISNVFKPSSLEAILQFYNDAGGITGYASAVIPNPQSPLPTFVFTEQLKAAFAAETGDARATAWSSTISYNGTTYTYPTKYRSLATGANEEYFTVLRLAEQYLIRAEARAQQNNVSGSRTDLLAVRQRAGLGATAANDREALLLAVERERRVELNCEMGHRWFDLKRTGRINAILDAVKTTWKPEAALYPVPADQRSRNGNLTQNPGYN